MTEQSNLLDQLDDFLATYNGRDKFMKAFCYGLKFATGFTSSDVKVSKLKSVSSEISNCRMILRFLDYIPVLKYTLSYNFAHKETDKYLKIIGFLSSVIDPIFYPMEQIAWAAERKLLKADSEYWSDAGTICWVVSLYLNLMKSLRSLSLLERHKRSLKYSDPDFSIAMKRVLFQQRGLFLFAIRTSCDLTYAIHYLPRGFLWSGRLPTWQVGLLGLTSAAISIYQAFSSKPKL